MPYFNYTIIRHMSNQIAVFEQKKIRHIEHEGEMYFSVVDVIEALTDSPNPRRYWSDLKKREPQLYEICVQLKIESTDSKFYKTDCAKRRTFEQDTKRQVISTKNFLENKEDDIKKL